MSTVLHWEYNLVSSSDSIAMLPSDNYPNIKYQKLPFWYKLFIIGMYIDKLFYIKHQSTIYIYIPLAENIELYG